MNKNIQTALNDWHINVVSEMKINDPSKLAEYALHISRIVAYDHLVIKDELSKIDEIGMKIVRSLKDSFEIRPIQLIEKIKNSKYLIGPFSKLQGLSGEFSVPLYGKACFR